MPDEQVPKAASLPVESAPLRCTEHRPTTGSPHAPVSFAERRYYADCPCGWSAGPFLTALQAHHAAEDHR